MRVRKPTKLEAATNAAYEAGHTQGKLDGWRKAQDGFLISEKNKRERSRIRRISNEVTEAIGYLGNRAVLSAAGRIPGERIYTTILSLEDVQFLLLLLKDHGL